MTTPQGPILETERLILRPPAMEDLPRWIDCFGDEETGRFIGGAQSPNLAWRSMMAMAGAWTLGEPAMFSVIEKSTGRWVGRLGPWRPFGWPGDEVGWTLHRDAHGKGYAVEGASAAIDYAFDVMGWTDVIHCIVPENLPSARVAERLGSRNLGPTRMPEPFHDLAVDAWGQSREEWRARRR